MSAQPRQFYAGRPITRNYCADCGQRISTRYPTSLPQPERCRECSKVKYDRQYILDRIIINDAGCWIWQQYLDEQGYAHGLVGGEWSAYRLAYRLWKGPIPEKAEIDHACHDPESCLVPPKECPHRPCVNPDHLEALTRPENARKSGNPFGVNARKTHCDAGHEFTSANTIWTSRGSRRCRACHNAERRARRARKRAEAQLTARTPA